MVRISGVELPAEKRIEAGLPYIYGLGRNNVVDVLKKAQVDANKRVKNLDDAEIARLQKVIDTMPVEGILRKIIGENIKRLKQIGAYRGLRHSVRLPSRGQRTRSNARTKRGKRVTIGALKKEAMTKMTQTQTAQEKAKTA
jgi:small subunit ribosomal protein S13